MLLSLDPARALRVWKHITNRLYVALSTEVICHAEPHSERLRGRLERFRCTSNSNRHQQKNNRGKITLTIICNTMNIDNTIASTIHRSLSQDNEPCGRIDERKRGFRKRNVRTASSSNVTMDFREPSNFQKLPRSDLKETTSRSIYPSFHRDEIESIGHFDGGRSVRSYSSQKTASTAATSETSSTSQTLEYSKTSTKIQTSGKKKEVTWEDMLGKGPLIRREAQSTTVDEHFEKISLEDNTLKAAKKLKELEREFKKLESHIPEACKMELAYLNHAGEVRMKRDQLNKQLQSVREHPTASGDDIPTAAHLEIKIEKARRMESLYLKKSKELHDKRYRWSQQYIYTIREWEKAGGEPRVNILLKLPPVRPPTVVGSGSRRIAASSLNGEE